MKSTPIYTRIILLAALFLCNATLFAQDFYGKAIYQTGSSMAITFAPAEEGDSTKAKKVDFATAKQKEMSENIRKAMQKEYALLFNKTESIYKEIPKMKSDAEGKAIEVVGLGGGTEGGLYKDVRNKKMVENRDLFGKLFLIEDNLESLQWELTQEQKKIGAYNCFKATATKTTTYNRMVDGKPVEKTRTKTITAWYTPEIPISQGPAAYWGLPGFILEVNTGRLNILCSKIILNPEETITIKIPTKGKSIDKASFSTLYEEKVKEMASRYNEQRKKERS